MQKRGGFPVRYVVVSAALGSVLAIAITLVPVPGDRTPAPAALEDSESTVRTTRASQSSLGEPADLAADDPGRAGEADAESAPVGPDDLPGDAFTRMQRSIEAREYQATRNDRGLQAPNRNHRLRTYFEPTGIRVHDRSAQGGDPELLTLRWTGVGRGTSLAAVPEGEVSHEGARVEIRREGMLE
jgi:hypothetical protein